MSRRKNTRRASLLKIAGDIERKWPQHAAYLRSLTLGRSKETEADGFTKHTKNKAALVLEFRRRRKSGEDEGEVLDELATRAGESYDRICNLVSLANDPDVRSYLAQYCARDGGEFSPQGASNDEPEKGKCPKIPPK